MIWQFSALLLTTGTSAWSFIVAISARDANSTQWRPRLFCYTARRPHPEWESEKDMDPAEIKVLIENGISGAIVEVFSDDNTHYAARIISSEFEGQRSIARHQRVYACLGTMMGNEIHALSIRAYTPEEWASASTDT